MNTNAWGMIFVISLIGFGVYSNNSSSIFSESSSQNSQITSGPNGEVYVLDKGGKRITFATKSGVIYKQANIDAPETFVTYKHFKEQIHNSKDSLDITAEWIGEKVYWNISTNGMNTRNASDISLSSIHGSPIIPLCGQCVWSDVFDQETGNTIKYVTAGVSSNVTIDMWNSAVNTRFRATADKK